VAEVVATAIQVGNAHAFSNFTHYARARAELDRNPVRWRSHSPPLPANHSLWTAEEAVVRSYPALHALRAGLSLPALTPSVPFSNNFHSMASTFAVDASLISKECEGRALEIQEVEGSGDCLPLSLKEASAKAELAGAPKFKDSQDVRDQTTDYVLKLLEDEDHDRLAIFFPDAFDAGAVAAGFDYKAHVEDWCKDAKQDKRHVGDTFVAVFGDLVAANMEIYKIRVDNGGVKSVGVDCLDFNTHFKHHQDEEFEWRGLDKFNALAERKLRVAYICSRRTDAEMESAGFDLQDHAHRIVGHYDWIMDLLQPIIHVAPVGPQGGSP
jgi:hypothetical protein